MVQLHHRDRVVAILQLKSEGVLAALEGVGAAVSRRQVLSGGASAFGGISAAGLLGPTLAAASVNRGPHPIPGGFDAKGNPVPKDAVAHVLPPGIGFEMSTITDFNGVVAGSETRGRAHGSDGTNYGFDTDMRFMHGTYRGLDGRIRRGAFGFI
jgi:hypothetical protein